jgi:hypothetical protein
MAAVAADLAELIGGGEIADRGLDAGAVVGGEGGGEAAEHRHVDAAGRGERRARHRRRVVAVADPKNAGGVAGYAPVASNGATPPALPPSRYCPTRCGCWRWRAAWNRPVTARHGGARRTVGRVGGLTARVWLSATMSAIEVRAPRSGPGDPCSGRGLAAAFGGGGLARWAWAQAMGSSTAADPLARRQPSTDVGDLAPALLAWSQLEHSGSGDTHGSSSATVRVVRGGPRAFRRSCQELGHGLGGVLN